MPPKAIKEFALAKAEEKAKEILSNYGYNHPDTVIDYDNAVEIIVDLLMKK